MRPTLSALRAWLKHHQLDAFILPHGDPYLGEYVASHDEGLCWLTGFSGSAGFAVVTQHQAWLYTDGRYQTQGAQQLVNSGFELRHSGRAKWDEDLAAAEAKGAIGFDPWLHSIEWHAQYEKKLAAHHWRLMAAANPLKELWQGRPPVPAALVEIQGLNFAGESSADKCRRLGEKLAAQNAAAELVNDATLVAWLLNIRGRDVAHIPVVQARAMLHASGQAELFIDPHKLSDAVRAQLDAHITVHRPDQLQHVIKSLHGKTLRLPSAHTPYALLQYVHEAGGVADTSASVILTARAIKNQTEQDGARRSHLRDAAALVQFFAALPELIKTAPREAELARVIAQHRARQADYVEESFSAIVGWQGNGAIVHYRAPDEGSAQIAGNGVLLIDSGGQYRCGTTDITRTIAIGAPGAHAKEMYTRVLKGHLAIARAQFPVGTTGGQLDALARQFLWAAGLDYDHGTGHGVGSFLSVHEGPQRISNRPDSTALEVGMILSNEPGCYLPGKFGVRIENLVLVIPAERPNFLRFETLTLVPYDCALIDAALLSPDEIVQINQYHAEVLAALSHAVDEKTKAFLLAQTQSISA